MQEKALASVHSVGLEPTKLILIGTRTTYQATGVYLVERGFRKLFFRLSITFYNFFQKSERALENDRTLCAPCATSIERLYGYCKKRSAPIPADLPSP